MGCISENFIPKGYSFVTFQRLMKQRLINIDKESKSLSAKGLIEYTIEFFKFNCGIDLTDYIAKTVYLDAITMNEDRHLYNMGILESTNGKRYIKAPIFDNGLSLLSDNHEYGHMSVNVAIGRVKSKPFSSSFAKQIRAMQELTDVKLVIDGARLDKLLDSYENIYYDSEIVKRAKNVLMARTGLLEGKIWERK